MAGQLYLQRETQEGTDQDDDGEYRHTRQGGFRGDSADDVPNHQQLQAEQDRPAGLRAERRQVPVSRWPSRAAAAPALISMPMTMTPTPAAAMTSPILSIAWL